MTTEHKEPPPEPYNGGSLKDFELAWEKEFPKDGEPQHLWRLVSARSFKKCALRHTSWFTTEKAANAHAAWIENGRGKVLSITHYVISDAGKE